MSTKSTQAKMELFSDEVKSKKYNKRIAASDQKVVQWVRCNRSKITDDDRKIHHPKETWNWSDTYIENSNLYKMKSMNLITQNEDGTWSTTKKLIHTLSKQDDRKLRNVVRI